MCHNATEKGGPRWASPPSLAIFVARDQEEGKRPESLALATACVRLWTPSLL
jgi:hypothetical protein